MFAKYFKLVEACFKSLYKYFNLKNETALLQSKIYVGIQQAF